MLLHILGLGEDVLNEEGSEDQPVDTQLLSIGQDISHLVSGGRTVTSKYMDIWSHCSSSNKTKTVGTVQLFHAAGYFISYEKVFQIDTSIACDMLQQYADSGVVFAPDNFVYAKQPGYIRYANDNININEETLDGQDT